MSPDRADTGLIMRPKSSALHRSVSSMLDLLGVQHRVEQPVLDGTYYIDIVITKPPTTLPRDAAHSQARDSAATAAAAHTPDSSHHPNDDAPAPSAKESSCAQEIALEVDGPTHFVAASMLPPNAESAAPEAVASGGASLGRLARRGRSECGEADAAPGLVLNSATLLKRVLLEKEGYQVV